jgi:integrase
MAPKKSKSKRKRSWPNVYSRKHRSGQTSYVVDLGLINGKRERYSFKTKTEAGTFAELKKTERQNQGTAALALPYEIKVDAAKASTLLTPHNVSLEEAAKYFAQHVIAYRDAPIIRQIVAQMIAEAEKNDRRDQTVSDLKGRLTMFAEDIPDRRLSELTVEEIQAWIDEDEEWSARTRINYLTKISQLFNYALKHNWVDANLVERIDRPSAEDSEPKIFTVEQAAKLVQNANKFGLLPCISLGLFAGLRSAELMRMDGADVKFDDRSIIVGQQVAEKRSRRVVDMCDALYAWLKPLKTLKSPIVDVKEFRDNMDELKKAAELETWPHNGLRHSFGSYHLTFHGDAIKTAGQMGHRSSDVVHNHYKVLVLKTEAEKFWNLRPRSHEAAKHPMAKKSRSSPAPSQ